MSTKPTKLIGLSIQDFDELVSTGKEIHLQPARLIPFYKPGNEMALTSIFLSGTRLVKEFRNDISLAINLTRSNLLRIYTEVEFQANPIRGKHAGYKY